MNEQEFRPRRTKLIEITASVGSGGKNLDWDVETIIEALLAIGPEQGGYAAAPLDPKGQVGGMIRGFQDFHQLPLRDGRVDPGGTTLWKINSILFPHLTSPDPPKPKGPALREIDAAAKGLPTGVKMTVSSPIETSLSTEKVINWTAVFGEGRAFYFELKEEVIPKWFGVLVPSGVTSFENINIFFHPTPAQAGISDADYFGLAGFGRIFHYLGDEFAAQFCAAGTGRVMVMPLLTQSAAGSCGIFAQRWESLIGKMLGMIKSGTMKDTAAPINIKSVVVTSYSAGIAFSHAFRQKANLSGRLKSIIDIDGDFSTYKEAAGALAGKKNVVKVNQAIVPVSSLPVLAAQGVFPVAPERWDKIMVRPLKNGVDGGTVHGLVQRRLMCIAAKRAG